MEGKLRSVRREVVICLVVGTVLGAIASFAIPHEDDERLSHVIGICVWGVALAIAVSGLCSRTKYRWAGRVILVAVAAIAGIWLKTEVDEANGRRALLRQLSDRYGWTDYDHEHGHWIYRKLMVPKGAYTSEELTQLQSAFPNAKIEFIDRP